MQVASENSVIIGVQSDHVLRSGLNATTCLGYIDPWICWHSYCWFRLLTFNCKGLMPTHSKVDFNRMKCILHSADQCNACIRIGNTSSHVNCFWILLLVHCPPHAAIFAPRSLQVCSKRAAQLVLQPKVMPNFAPVDDASGSEIDTSSFQTKPSSWKRLGFAKIICNS